MPPVGNDAWFGMDVGKLAFRQAGQAEGHGVRKDSAFTARVFLVFVSKKAPFAMHGCHFVVPAHGFLGQKYDFRRVFWAMPKKFSIVERYVQLNS